MSQKAKDLVKPLMKPIHYAEQQLVISMLNGQFPPGSNLPGERELSQQIGVTRQTLREAIQRLAKDRWIKVQHGKPTVVNDYWQEGGMGILGTAVEYARFLPPEFIDHLLEARVLFMPACAVLSIRAMPDKFLEYLDSASSLKQTDKAFAEFDRTLQVMMAKYSGNMVYRLFFNDYHTVLTVLGEDYFKKKKGRIASMKYYITLADAIRNDGDVETVVKKAMEESLILWRSFQDEGENQS